MEEHLKDKNTLTWILQVGRKKHQHHHSPSGKRLQMLTAFCNIHPSTTISMTPPTLGPRGAGEELAQEERGYKLGSVYITTINVLFFLSMQQVDLDNDQALKISFILAVNYLLYCAFIYSVLTLCP